MVSSSSSIVLKTSRLASICPKSEMSSFKCGKSTDAVKRMPGFHEKSSQCTKESVRLEFKDNLSEIGIKDDKKLAESLREEAEQLRATLSDIERQARELAELSELDHIRAHYDRLKQEIGKSVAERILHLLDVGDEKVKQIDEHRDETIASRSSTSSQRQAKRQRKCSPCKIAAKFTADLVHWREKRPTCIEKARAHVEHLEAKVQQMRDELRRETLGDRFLEWRSNPWFLLQRSQLGEFVSALEDDSSLEEEQLAPSTPELAFTFKDHEMCVHDVVFLADEKLASCSLDRTIVISQHGNTVSKLQTLSAAAISLAVLSNGGLAAGCDDGTIQIWDLKATELVRTLGRHKCKVFSLKVLRDGNLASISWDNTIKIWNPYSPSSHLLNTMHSHDNCSVGLELGLLSSGNLVTCSNEKSHSRDSVIKIWDPFKGLQVQTVPTKCTGVAALLVLKDDRVVLGLLDGRIKLFDVETQNELASYFTPTRIKIYCMAELPNDLLVVAGFSFQSEMNILDLKNGSVVCSTPTSSRKIWALSVSQDGRFLAASSSDSSVKVWTLV